MDRRILTPGRRDFLRRVAGVGAALAGGGVAARALVESSSCVLRRIEVPVRDLPPAFAGYRVAHLSDLHFGFGGISDLVDDAIAISNALEPDLVALTGDFLGGRGALAWPLCERLADLRARDGVFAVPGNHEYGVFRFSRRAVGRGGPPIYAEVPPAFERAGVPLLRNEHVWLRRGGARVALVGVDDLWADAARIPRAFGELPDDAPRIVLAHNPDTTSLLEVTRTDLVLSGHTHGGQVKLPLFGTPHAPVLRKEFTYGLVPFHGGHVHVSGGIGFSFLPVRFGVPPEVTEITLVRAGQAAETAADGSGA